MLKSNRKLILLLILVLVIGVLGGCKKKAPEGIGQTFYDDIVKSLNKLSSMKTKSDDDGYYTISQYLDSQSKLSDKEKKIIEEVDQLYFYAWLQRDSKDSLWEKDLKKQMEIVSKLLDIEIKE